MFELPTPSWLNSAGGLRYHWRARRHGALWQPFRQALAPLLRAFAEGCDALLLVGPSAGYALQDDFLMRFRRLTLLEPDPSAVFLLRRRCARLGANVELNVVRRDLLIAALLSGAAGLPELLAEIPEQPVLFCNLLGQVSFLVDEVGYVRWQAAFRERVWPALQGRPWFSFHDRISGKPRPNPAAIGRSNPRLTERMALEKFYPQCLEAADSDLFDHLTFELFPPELPGHYLSWQISPTYHHLIEVLGSSLARPLSGPMPTAGDPRG